MPDAMQAQFGQLGEQLMRLLRRRQQQPDVDLGDPSRPAEPQPLNPNPELGVEIVGKPPWENQLISSDQKDMRLRQLAAGQDI